MGNIFYYLLTGSEPFQNLKKLKGKDVIKEMVRDGTKPELREEYWLSRDSSVMALIEAMQMCHEYDYQKRSKAKAIRDFLIDRLTRKRAYSNIRS